MPGRAVTTRETAARHHRETRHLRGRKIRLPAAAITALAGLDAEDPGPDLVGALADAVATASLCLQELIVSYPAIGDMGTTLTAILWGEGHAALCHVGDSRA